MKQLKLDTFIPISFIGTIIIATLWIGNINSKADAALNESVLCTQNIQRTQNEATKYMFSIEKRLTRIEALLEKRINPAENQ
jgi:hypothetical protein